MATLRNVDDIATHSDLANVAGGEGELQRLLPDDWDGESTIARARAYEAVVRALQKRTPPINESDLSDPSELRDVVVDGALAFLYSLASSSPDDSFSQRSDFHRKQFQSELSGLSPRVIGTGRVGISTISVERR